MRISSQQFRNKWYVNHNSEDCGGTPRRKFPLKPAKIPYITMWQYWFGNTKPKDWFQKVATEFKKKLFYGIFYWLTDWLTD